MMNSQASKASPRCGLATATITLSPTFEIDSEHVTALSKSIRLAYEKKTVEANVEFKDGDISKSENAKEIEVDIGDVVGQLSSLTSQKEYELYESAVADLLKKLKPFYGDGIYSSYFKVKGSKAYREDCKTYLYDLDGLSDPILKTLMAMAILEEVRQVIKQSRFKENGGWILYEEIGMLARNFPVIANHVVESAETSRKLGFFLISTTPDPKNYFTLDAAKAAWNAADNYVFFEMNDDAIEEMAKQSALLDEASIEIIKSLRTERNKWAEVFYTDKKRRKRGAFKFVRSSTEAILYPTTVKDKEKVFNVIRSGSGTVYSRLKILI